MQKQSIRWIGIAVAIMLVSSFLAYQTGVSSAQVSSSTVATLNQWAGLRDCTYQIFSTGADYYSQSCDSGAIAYSGTNAATVVQSTIDAMTTGGKIFFKQGTYTFTTGLTIDTLSSTVHYALAGEGAASVLKFTGSGYLLTVDGASTSNKHFDMEDLRLTGESKTTGRHGIRDIAPGPMATYNNLHLDNFDTAITIEDTNGRWLSGLRIVTCNVGIKTLDGDNSQPNGINIRDFWISSCATAGIQHNPDDESGVSLHVENGVIDTSEVGIHIQGSGSNFHIKDMYFEDNNTVDIYLEGFDNTYNLNSVLIENVRGQGLDSTPNMIKMDFANKVTVQNTVAFNYTGSMVLANVNFEHKLLMINPLLVNTPYLVDSGTTLTTVGSRLIGKVIENDRTGVIVFSGTASVVEGDVVVIGGANAFFSTTSAGASIPMAVMYANAGANKPIVLADSGITRVNVNGTTAVGDTLQTSTTAKQAQVNNSQTDPKKIIGFVTEAGTDAGLRYARIL